LVSVARAAQLLGCDIPLVRDLALRRVIRPKRHQDGTLRIPVHEINALLRVPREETTR
jgi:hypothetical protein